MTNALQSLCSSQLDEREAEKRWVLRLVLYVVFCVVTEAVGQLSIDMYSGAPSNTSSCINVVMPEALGVGEPLVFDGSATSGTVNALSIDTDDEVQTFSLRECDLHWINDSYDLGLSHGLYQMTIIDWTDDPSCSLLVIVFKRQGQLSVPCSIESKYCPRF